MHKVYLSDGWVKFHTQMNLIHVELKVKIDWGLCLLILFAARDYHFDVVLIDTAGRMQDNEPLMRALSKVRLN